jgi:nitroreductase
VLLTRASPAHSNRESAALFEQAGRAVAHMSFLARAKGLVSIIKSGPVEIARAKITRIVGEAAPDPECRRQIAAGTLAPLVTFQLGYPLGPEEIVSKGQPDAHSGLAERLLDRRAVRSKLSEHYVPVSR